MRLFIDTANLDEIKEAASWGVVSGVTTNPSLIAKEGRDLKESLMLQKSMDFRSRNFRNSIICFG